MTSAGDLEDPYSCMKMPFSFNSGVDHVYLAHALNKSCCRTGRKYELNNQILRYYNFWMLSLNFGCVYSTGTGTGNFALGVPAVLL